MRIGEKLIKEIMKEALRYEDMIRSSWETQGKDVNKFKKELELFLDSINKRIVLQQLHYDDVEKIIKSVEQVTNKQIKLEKTEKGLEIIS